MDNNSSHRGGMKNAFKENYKAMQQKPLHTDDIKELLGVPEFSGVHILEHALNNCKITLPPQPFNENSKFSHIPEYLKSNRNTVYGTSKTAACGDHGDFLCPKLSGNRILEKFNYSKDKNEQFNYIARSSLKKTYPIKLDPDVLSGYEEYVQQYCTPEVGLLRVTPQATLSLTLADMQVDITVDGAIRVVNPKAYVAVAVDHNGNDTAMMHPMGRVLQEASITNLMAYDVNGCHKFAKLLPQKAIFKSTEMTFAYVMDMAGTRTTMSTFPSMSSNDISLPVFYSKSNHGPQCKREADKLLRCATRCMDTENNTTWIMNGIMIKYKDGDLRVLRPPHIFIHTSSATGQVGVSTSQIHCTASQGEAPHLFVRYGPSKMHYNGRDFKLRTMSQAAGFDADNHITLY